MYTVPALTLVRFFILSNFPDLKLLKYDYTKQEARRYGNDRSIYGEINLIHFIESTISTDRGFDLEDNPGELP